jgi:ribosomal protein L29
MSPQELQEKLDDAKHAPVHDKAPREIGELANDYRPRKVRIVPTIDPSVAAVRLTSIKAHMRELTDEEWAQMAREIRGDLRIRLCNDEVINALLRAWAQG